MIAQNLADYINMNAVRRAERLSLVDATRSLTYAELGREMHRTAAFLQDQGVQRGDIVGLTMRDGVDHVVTMLAILRLGAVLLPLDTRWTSVEKDNVARLFGASHAVTDAPEACILSATQIIDFDRDAIVGTTRQPDLPSDFNADEPLLLSLSSGTTGTPKGPQLSHRQMMLRHYTEWLSLGFLADDVNLCATPLYFGGGRGFTLSYLLGGATVVFCPPPYRPDDIAAAIRTYGVTTTFLVPTLLRRVADASDEVRAAVRSLRFIICSGSALHPAERAEMLERVNANILNFYASTEGGGVAALFASDDVGQAKSVGRPLLGSELSITDDDGRQLSAGEIGHIRHRAPWHPSGFFRNPTETQRYFQQGWYLPGDLGYLDEAGFLFITGRAKDMIIRGGINIYPNEIEAVLVSHPGISEAAVVGRPSQQFGEDVVAFIVCSAKSVDPDELAQFCRSVLATYKIPTAFHVLDALPRNSGGKVVKSELAETFPDRLAG